jgi:hypothetical protein
VGGGIRSTADPVKLGEVYGWFQCDNQVRGGDDTPIWGCALQGRVCNAVQQGKMATNVTAAWSTGTSVRGRRRLECAAHSNGELRQNSNRATNCPVRGAG